MILQTLMLLEVIFINVKRHLKSHYLNEDLKNRVSLWLFRRKERNCFSSIFSVRLFRNWEVCVDKEKFSVFLIVQWKRLLTCMGRNWDVRYVNISRRGKKIGTFIIRWTQKQNGFEHSSWNFGIPFPHHL